MTTFNAILATGHIPASFLHGHVIPIPKGHDRDLRDPSNYRGISLLSSISKVLEKVLINIISPDISLNPLQGGFRSGYSCLHTAYILQEAIQHTRERSKKAYVAFLDARKAFDTVWHEGLFVKLHNKGLPMRIWHLLYTWYKNSSCSVAWNNATSASFPIHQGVRQGAILSPLLYSIFVDELLDLLSISGLGVRANSIYIGAPMYADDLALIAESPQELQAMLNIVHSYAGKWRYNLNACKSFIMVFGESPRSRTQARSLREWHLGSEKVQEVDEVHHLGILRSVSFSTLSRTTERSTAGRSAFFALNAVGSRFGCLHPVTSYKLYSTLSIPIMLYGSELWSLTSTELNILERTHRKILPTIQGLPIRCPAAALQSLIGSRSILSYMSQRQLAFINSIINMQASDLPKQLLEARVANPRAKGITVTWGNLLDELCLPSIKQLLSTPRNKETWKRSIKRLLNIRAYITMLDQCEEYPLGDCDLPIGRPAPHWTVTLQDTHATRRNNFRIRLLVGCDGLEADASRFRWRKDRSQPNNPTCKLCHSEPEDPLHFIAKCPALSPVRSRLLSATPETIKPHLPDLEADPLRFAEVVLGLEWIKDTPTQMFIIDFLTQLKSARSSLILRSD